MGLEKLNKHNCTKNPLFASIKFVNVSRNVLKVPSINNSKLFSLCKVHYYGAG